MTDRVIAGERSEGVASEHVGHQAFIFMNPRATPVADRDAGRLLSTVLESEEPEEGHLGDPIAVGSGDAEHSALLVRSIVGGAGDVGFVHPLLPTEMHPRRHHVATSLQFSLTRPSMEPETGARSSPVSIVNTLR